MDQKINLEEKEEKKAVKQSKPNTKIQTAKKSQASKKGIKKNVLAKKKSIKPSKPKEKSMEVAKKNYHGTKVKVSVVIPCYNHGAFLKEAIQSALESTFDHYEIIIVNDGSKDAFTVKVLKELEQKFANDQRIKIIHQDNLGPSDARNKAIKLAKGEYILPLDADNKIRPHYLSKAAEILDNYPEIGVVYAYAKLFGDREGVWEFPVFHSRRLLLGNFVEACSVYRRKVWEECNGYDPNMRIGYEDWELWISAMEKGWKFHLIKEVLFDYRVLSNSRVSYCHIPKNRRNLIKYICNKHKDTYIENLAYVISEKDVAILHVNNHASNLEHHARNLEGIIKDQDTHIGNLDAQVQDKERHIHNIEKHIQAKDTHIGNLVEQIDQLKKELQAKDGVIQEQAQHIEAKDAHIKNKDVHIRNIESELSLMRRSRVWRLAEFFRRLFYIKLLGKFPLLQKGVLTISREGSHQFFLKVRDFIKRDKKAVFPQVIEGDYNKWIEKNRLTENRINKIKKDIAEFKYKPKISIIMPVYNVDQIWLEKAIGSVMNQIYENWELCIADDASTKRHIKQTLERFLKNEKRIKVKYLKQNQGISMASNEALSLATGEFVALLDNDDELTIDALYTNVRLLNENPQADLIYSDEDKIDTHGNRIEPFFKPDYSPDFLLTNNYICHFSLFRKSLIDKIGGFRRGYEGSQDYDLILRFIEKTKPEKIFHVPKILYHWRKIPGSAAAIADAKSYAFVSAKKALLDYLRRNSIQGEVVDGNFVGSYRVRREIKNDYKVSIIIPFRDQSELLRRCVNSIIGRTKYREYELVLVNDQSEKEESFEYLDKIKDNSILRVLDYDKPFNFSAITNYAVSQINSEYLILLNNDTEVISPDWIEAMLEFAQRKDVGAVGALLYYPNDTIQHGGIILGIKGVAAHSHLGSSRDSMGYFGRLKTIQNLSAVTAACLMTKKEIFKEVDGFDENYTHAFNDVDFCLKIRQKGYLIVYTPYAELYHHESLTRGYEDTPEKKLRFKKEIEYFQGRWKEVLSKGDLYYNPNLTLEREDFSIRI